MFKLTYDTRILVKQNLFISGFNYLCDEKYVFINFPW